MRARHMNTVLHSSRSPDSVWWSRVRFVLGVAQIAAAVVAVVAALRRRSDSDQSHGCRRGVVTDIGQRDAVR
jgi:hypothetical protein